MEINDNFKENQILGHESTTDERELIENVAFKSALQPSTSCPGTQDTEDSASELIVDQVVLGLVHSATGNIKFNILNPIISPGAAEPFIGQHVFEILAAEDPPTDVDFGNVSFVP